MTESPVFLAERLQVEGERTLAFFNAFSAAEWEKPIYADGGHWNARQILAHLVAAERALQELMKNVLQGGEGAPAAFDLDSYNEEQVEQLSDCSAPALLEEFSQSRRQSVDFVAGLQAQDLEKQGRHPFLGMAPLAEMIKLMYRHTQIHQRDIRKSLAGA
mgnify:CR=1 FL=1